MLTLQFVPYHEIENLDTNARINKLLNLVKDDKIVLMQGRLKVSEETKLIETTMFKINSKFKGIEVCTIYPKYKQETVTEKIKKEMIKMLLGNREGVTIIGPATIVKEIKRDPNKILLLTRGAVSNKKRKRRR